MFTEKQIKKINTDRDMNRYEYLGLLSEYQTVSKKLVQKIIFTEYFKAPGFTRSADYRIQNYIYKKINLSGQSLLF